MKRTLTLIMLALTLAFPVGAFAAVSEGTTTETLTVDATVSMTVTAEAEWLGADVGGSPLPDLYEYAAVVTIVGTNNPAGVTVKVKVDPWTSGSISIPTSNRRVRTTEGTIANPDSPLNTVTDSQQSGAFPNASTYLTLASSSVAIANESFRVAYEVDAAPFSVGGQYNSTAYYVASTN